MKKSFLWPLYLELIALLVLGCFGVYAAFLAGINYDEAAEFRTYLVNMEAIQGLLDGRSEGYEFLTQYHDRYYGVGFHLFSHGISFVLNQWFGNLLPFSLLGSRLIWAHATTFLLFLLSGLLVRECLKLLIRDRLISSLGMFTFLLWPYLFGHALMNVKDIPFMFAWLACTYIALRIFELPINFTKPLAMKLVLLGAFTGWLISIRVSGILIYVEYFWFAVFWVLRNKTASHTTIPITQLLELMGAFLIPFSLTLFILYPILWHNPTELIQAIIYMGSHPWQGNTLTAGKLIEPKVRLFFYIPAWLMAKLPIFIILGLLVTTFWMVRECVVNKDRRYSATLVLYLSLLTILGLLVIRRVALYNELRQLLFIAPLLMMVAIVGLSLVSKKFTVLILLVTSMIMLLDDIKLHPYQYTYVNEVIRHTDLGSKYETDYYGLSVKETARWLNESQIDGQSQCLFVPTKHLWDFEINPHKFPCVGEFPGDLSLITKPFLFYVHARSVTGFSAPPWCRLLHVEERLVPFSGIKLLMGELYECNPTK